MKPQRIVVLALAASGLLIDPRPVTAASCESLAALPLPHVTVTLANLVDAGTFVQLPPARGGGGGGAPPAPPAGRVEGAARGAGAGGGGGRGAAAPTPFADLPAFCRVT